MGKASVIVFVLLSVVSLAGCAGGEGSPASSGRPPSGELSGVWTSAVNGGVELRLSADGTFAADEWPSNLGCRSPTADRVEDFDWHDLRRFDGDWQFGPEGYEYGILLRFDSPECKGAFILDAWDDGDGTILRKWLGSDADDVSSSRLFDLVRG